MLLIILNVIYFKLCSSRKYPYSPHRRNWNFLGDGGFWKIKKYKEMYDVLAEFPEGWGGVRKKPFRGGGMYIFWNYTLLIKSNLSDRICNTHSNAKVAKSHFQKQTVPSPPVDTRYLRKHHKLIMTILKQNCY